MFKSSVIFISLLLLLGALAGCTQPTPPFVVPPNVRVDVESNIQLSYRQGETGSASFSITLVDPDNAIAFVTPFLNIVEGAPGSEVQVGHLIFADANESPRVFRVPFTGATLQAGVTTTLNFTIRDDAPPGTYLLALQFFPGRNTDPNSVRPRERLGFSGFEITILPR